MTEQEVKAVIAAGADTVAEVTRVCCAGDDCGACHQTIEDMIEEHDEARGCSKRRLAVVRAA